MTDTSRWVKTNKCTLGYSVGPQSMVVQQVLGARETQKSIDIHVRVPRHKPSIEQIIDVMVKRLRITSVDVIPDKVVVRGEFEVKALYVACLPRQPVHAVEVWPVRFTAYVDIRGARRGMDADANVMVEFIDYDVDEHTRAHWYKQKEQWYDHHDHCDWDDDWDDCDDDCDCDCGWDDDCGHKHKPHGKHKWEDECKSQCKPKCKPYKHYGRCRDFDVSVVLRITVKVMTDREVIINYGNYGLPAKPKG